MDELAKQTAKKLVDTGQNHLLEGERILNTHPEMASALFSLATAKLTTVVLMNMDAKVGFE